MPQSVQVFDVTYTTLMAYVTANSAAVYYIETLYAYEVFTTLGDPLELMAVRNVLSRIAASDDLTDFEDNVKDTATEVNSVEDGLEPQLEIVTTPPFTDPLQNGQFENWTHGTFFNGPSIGTELADHWFVISLSAPGSGQRFLARANTGETGFGFGITFNWFGGTPQYYIGQTVDVTGMDGFTLRFSVDVQTNANQIKPWAADDTGFTNFAQGSTNAPTDGNFNPVYIDRVVGVGQTSLVFGFYANGASMSAVIDNATITKL